MTFYEGVGFLLLSCCLIVYSLVSHAQAHIEWKQSPYLFPLLIALFLLPLSLSIIKQGLGACEHVDGKFQDKPTLIMIAATALYLGIMGYVGFLFSTSLFLLFIMRYLGEKRLVVIISLAVLFPVVLYLLFGMLLHVMLP
jgi:hypothetical protein